MLTNIPAPQFNNLETPGGQPGNLSVVGSVVFQQGREAPVACETRFSRSMKVVGEPEPTPLTLTEEWTPITPRELAGVSYIHIKNREGSGLQLMPTPEEARAISERVVEIAFGEGQPAACPVFPGEAFGFPVVDWKGVRVRCRKGKARVMVTLIPG